jgi:hypothetical protein
VAAGALLLAAPFLYANPFFGARFTRWPWEVFLDVNAPNPRILATYVVWTVAGAWCLAWGLTTAQGIRSAGAVALGAVLLLVCTEPSAGLKVLPDHNLPWLLGAVALAAGLRLLADPRHASAARALAFAGGIMILADHAFHFVSMPGGGRVAQLHVLWQDSVSFIWGADPAGKHRPYPWGTLITAWLLFASCACGILAGFGVRHRLFAIFAYVVLLIALLIPTAVRLGNDFRTAEFQGGQLKQQVGMIARQANECLLDDGIALWMLGAFGAVDLVRARRRAA